MSFVLIVFWWKCAKILKDKNRNWGCMTQVNYSCPAAWNNAFSIQHPHRVINGLIDKFPCPLGQPQTLIRTHRALLMHDLAAASVSEGQTVCCNSEYFRRIKEQSKHIPRLLKSKRSQSSDRRNGAFNLPHEGGLPQSHLRYCIITSLLACCTTLDASRGVWGPGRWGRLNTAWNEELMFKWDVFSDHWKTKPKHLCLC